MKAIPINESEAIFERFMDPLRSQFDRWSTSCEGRCGATAEQEWNSVKIAWHTGDGKTVCRLSRDVALELTGYNRLIVRLSLPSCARLTVKARCDGDERTVIANSPGVDDYSEHEGPISGSILERLEIEVVADGAIGDGAHPVAGCGG